MKIKYEEEDVNVASGGVASNVEHRARRSKRSGGIINFSHQNMRGYYA